MRHCGWLPARKKAIENRAHCTLDAIRYHTRVVGARAPSPTSWLATTQRCLLLLPPPAHCPLPCRAPCRSIAPSFLALSADPNCLVGRQSVLSSSSLLTLPAGLEKTWFHFAPLNPFAISDWIPKLLVAPFFERPIVHRYIPLFLSLSCILSSLSPPPTCLVALRRCSCSLLSSSPERHLEKSPATAPPHRPIFPSPCCAGCRQSGRVASNLKTFATLIFAIRRSALPSVGSPRGSPAIDYLSSVFLLLSTLRLSLSSCFHPSAARRMRKQTNTNIDSS